MKPTSLAVLVLCYIAAECELVNCGPKNTGCRGTCEPDCNCSHRSRLEAKAGVLLNVPACPEQHGVQTYAHPDLCDHFFKCTNGTVTLESCENGLLYDGKGSAHEHCNYNWAVDCGTRKADLTPISTPGCLYQFGIYPESAQCSKNYLKCAFGVPHTTPCEPGLAYDDKTHSCNWPDLLDFCSPEEIVGFKCPDHVPAHSLSAKFLPFPRFAVPGDCGRLITCVNGHPRLISCEAGKVLDESTLTCEDHELVPKCANYVRK